MTLREGHTFGKWLRAYAFAAERGPVSSAQADLERVLAGIGQLFQEIQDELRQLIIAILLVEFVCRH